MKNLIITCTLLLGLFQTANADIWKWVDANGKTHLVDSMRPIYTWIDESGKVHYADHPDHEDAVSVQLVWVSEGSLEEGEGLPEQAKDKGYAYIGETAEQRAERERAEAYYCQRATEVYDSYLNAPQLYRTDAEGKRQILSEAEAKQTIAETRAKKDQFCN